LEYFVGILEIENINLYKQETGMPAIGGAKISRR